MIMRQAVYNWPPYKKCHVSHFVGIQRTCRGLRTVILTPKSHQLEPWIRLGGEVCAEYCQKWSELHTWSAPLSPPRSSPSKGLFQGAGWGFPGGGPRALQLSQMLSPSPLLSNREQTKPANRNRLGTRTRMHTQAATLSSFDVVITNHPALCLTLNAHFFPQNGKARRGEAARAEQGAQPLATGNNHSPNIVFLLKGRELFSLLSVVLLCESLFSGAASTQSVCGTSRPNP
jgi:hypothetical protein